MSYSFETIDGKTLKASPNVDIPDWIDNIAFKEKVDRVFDLATDANIVNQKHVVASRSNNNTAFTRDIAYTFNNQTLKNFAVVKLSSFLRKTKFAILNSEPTNNGITFDVTFENNPAQYKFSYNANDGKINNDKFFIVALNDDVNEYPFSEAGLEDSFNDVKEGFDSKKSYKVKVGNNNFTVMTRYEIIKRCNGSLKEATDLINKNIKEGNIVGVGSNEYASYYDMNMLFPDKRENLEKEASHTADFVDNIGQTDINEKKTAERLSHEAVQKFANVINILNVDNAKRNDNILDFDAEIVNKDIRHKIAIRLSIEDEKVKDILSICFNEKDMQINDFLNEIDKKDKKIASYTGKNTKLGNHIFSMKNLTDELEKYISKDNVDSMIQLWCKSGKLNAIENNKFASKLSLNELLFDTEDISFLSKEEIDNILEEKQKFGNKFYRADVKMVVTKTAIYSQLKDYLNEDTVNKIIEKLKENNTLKSLDKDKFACKCDLEDLIKLCNETQLVEKKPVNYALAKRNDNLFESVWQEDTGSRNYQIIASISDYANKINSYLSQYLKDFYVELIDKKNAIITFDGKHVYASILGDIDDIVCDIHGKKISIAKLNHALEITPTLKAYLEDNDVSNYQKIIISKKMFENKLNDYFSDSEINTIISYLEDNNKLHKIAEDKYVSNSSFDELIKNINVSPNMQLKAKHLKLKDKKDGYRFESASIEDGDSRNNVANENIKEKIASIKEKINKYLKCDVKVVNDKDLVLDFDGRKLYARVDKDKIICKVGSKEVAIEDVSKAFEKSNLLKQYLQDNNYELVDHYSCIFTEDELNNILADYLSNEDIDIFIIDLNDNGILQSLGNKKFASKYSRDEILNECKKNIDTTLRKKHLILSNKNDNKQFEVINVEDTGTRNPEEQLSKANYKKLMASQMPTGVEIEDFKDIDIKEKWVTAELHLFNKEKGISSSVIAQSDIDNAKLKNTRFFIGNKEIDVKDAFVNTLLASKINEMRNNENTKHDILISKEALKKHLRFLTDDSQLDDAINSWLELGHVKEAGNNQYASKYSLNELISMSKLKPYMEEVINDNLKHASKNNEMIPKSFHTNNFEAKTLASIKDGKTNDAFNEVKDKVLKLAESYVEKSIITKNKLSKISALLDKVTTSHQLDSIYKDLQRYNK